MTTATLLVELLTEELPPKSLARLGEALRKALTDDLAQDGFLAAGSQSCVFATPRRLAVQATQVLAQSPDKALEMQGPSVKVGLDKDGKPTPALAGFAKKNGMTVEDLLQIDTPKGKVFACRKTATGSALSATLAGKVEAALKKLPVAKMMRWGDGDAEFVRPVHGLVMLHGQSIVPGTVLGIASGNTTRGHRFMGESTLTITDAEHYENILETSGKVVADFAKRRAHFADLDIELCGKLDKMRLLPVIAGNPVDLFRDGDCYLAHGDPIPPPRRHRAHREPTRWRDQSAVRDRL